MNRTRKSELAKHLKNQNPSKVTIFLGQTQNQKSKIKNLKSETLAQMAVENVAVGFLFFLAAKERPKEAPFAALEKKESCKNL